MRRNWCGGASAGLNASDCAAWSDLFDATGGSAWAHCSGSRLDPCGCAIYGSVVCTAHRITALNLVRNRLDGHIPATIGRLAKLTLIDLSENALTGGASRPRSRPLPGWQACPSLATSSPGRFPQRWLCWGG